MDPVFIKRELWGRYQKYLCNCPRTGVALDVSRMCFEERFLQTMSDSLSRALGEMDALEAGAIANPDENRMVGHYWLRDAGRAPSAEIADAIGETHQHIRDFARRIHAGEIRPQRADRFATVLVVGIGGSALGPQLVADALESRRDPMRARFIDNTDPDGIDRELDRIGGLSSTLTVVISKSGGTVETRNGMLEVAHRYKNESLEFARHVVAVTGADSALDRTARGEGWLDVFPMWDWVGGRTSVTSAVGLLPAALQGIDIDAFLRGARDMDETTRSHDALRNPAAMMALMWHHGSGGRGLKDLVILPYKDRLALLSRYLQQLVMESLGKEKDLDGRVVHQGLTVYGNKGSTDQHAYVQQLRDGVHNFFVTFIEVVRDREGPSIEVEPNVTTGDYLRGFLLGTREALFEKGRESMTLTIPEVSPRTLGALIALFERTVGLYASLININAYHQPGVEAGKKAAGRVIDLQRRVMAHLGSRPVPPSAGHTVPPSADEIAAAIGAPDEVETIHRILDRLSNERS